MTEIIALPLSPSVRADLETLAQRAFAMSLLCHDDMSDTVQTLVSTWSAAAYVDSLVHAGLIPLTMERAKVIISLSMASVVMRALGSSHAEFRPTA